MSNTVIFGIKNCDTMKKAFNWLKNNKITYIFHDYKKSGIDETILRKAIDQHNWDTVINRRGTTWRNLPEDTKNNMGTESAIKIAQENPSIVKRPLLLHENTIYLGFKNETYEQIFTNNP